MPSKEVGIVCLEVISAQSVETNSKGSARQTFQQNRSVMVVPVVQWGGHFLSPLEEFRRDLISDNCHRLLPQEGT